MRDKAKKTALWAFLVFAFVVYPFLYFFNLTEATTSYALFNLNGNSYRLTKQDGSTFNYAFYYINDLKDELPDHPAIVKLFFEQECKKDENLTLTIRYKKYSFLPQKDTETLGCAYETSKK